MIFTYRGVKILIDERASMILANGSVIRAEKENFYVAQGDFGYAFAKDSVSALRDARRMIDESLS